MNLHEKQQFDFFLMTSAERFVDRIVQRSAGSENALQNLRENPNGDGVWLDEFVTGACFILSALERRPITVNTSGKVDDVLQQMARQAFGELLRMKIIESLEQSVGVGK
jgi:hypothetical protein